MPILVDLHQVFLLQQLCSFRWIDVVQLWSLCMGLIFIFIWSISLSGTLFSSQCILLELLVKVSMLIYLNIFFLLTFIFITYLLHNFGCLRACNVSSFNFSCLPEVVVKHCVKFMPCSVAYVPSSSIYKGKGPLQKFFRCPSFQLSYLCQGTIHLFFIAMLENSLYSYILSISSCVCHCKEYSPISDQW